MSVTVVQFRPPDGYVLVPVNPSLAMLDAGWGICGTRLSEMQPCKKKIDAAISAYRKVLQLAQRGSLPTR